MSSSASSNKSSTWKRLRDPSVTSFCTQFAEMSITPGVATSSSSIPNRKRSTLEAFTSSSSIPNRKRSSLEAFTSSSSIPNRKRSSLEAFTAASSNIQEKTRRFKNSSIQNTFKYDVFLSFRGEDTRKNFVGHLYNALKDKGIYTYKDDEKIKQGKTINNQLIQAIKDSRFFIIVFSKNYASSSWCLDELVQIMDCQKTGKQTAYPVFFDVEPTEVRKQCGAVEKAFAEHEKKEAAGKWREAMKEASNLAGWELKATANGHEAEFIKKVVGEISLELRSITFGFDEKLVGMQTRVKDVVLSLKVGTDEFRMIGIKGMGGAGKTTTARAVFECLSNDDFEAKSFVANVREVSNGSVSGLKNLQEQVLSKVLNQHVILDSVDDGKNMMKRRMCNIKVLLVLDDVDHIDQLEALASKDWFKRGSIILITTRDEQVLVAHGLKLIRDINLLSEQEAICLFSRYAFGRENPVQGYEELSGKVVRYAAGLPLTIKVLGSFLCGKDKLEWVSAIERLKDIPLKETLKQLELSYISLEDDYKEIFLDIACILKGRAKEDVIRILECCGFHARNGLKVLEQRSLITISDQYGQLVLGMHDHIEEMGKNIVRREHRDEPNKHSRLWISEEIEDILTNDLGTEETRCLRLRDSGVNARIVMKGLGKMKKLRYLEVAFTCRGNWFDGDLKLNEATQYYSNSLKYLKCTRYPLLYLPKTFQADNLVGLKMDCDGRLVQLWEEGEKKILKKLKFLSLSDSNLTTFDFRITPNLETLSLALSNDLAQLFMPASCQMLKYVDISDSKLRTFDLGLTPNLETLFLRSCDDFEELQVSVACPNLKILNLSGSRLRSLDLELFPNLKSLNLSGSRLRSLDLKLIPNLERLDLGWCCDFVELQVSAPCPNLKSLNLSGSRLRSLDLEVIPNLESLDLQGCQKLVEINAPVGCLKRVGDLNLHGCSRFRNFHFRGRSEPKDNCSSATLALDGKSLDLCPLHPNSNLPKLQFSCYYEEYLSSSVGNIERLISFGLCACTDFKKFSDIICSLQCLQKLYLNIQNIPEFPNDLGKLECLAKLSLFSKKIKHLPDSICMLKRLKSLTSDGDLLEKLPEDLGRLECLEELYVRSKKIEYLPDSICMLKRLKSLIFSSDLLEKLTEDLGKLECLEKLRVSSKKIEHLPDSICMLKRLNYLTVDHCDLLEKLPEDLGKLECLEKLHVSSKKIENLPDSICMLKRLNSLTVDHCDLLEKLPEDLGKLECLEMLCVRSKKIEYLPDSICVLKRLKSLKVYECDLLEKLPEDIGQLECLEDLDVSSKKIEYLPDSICMLKHLKWLYVTECCCLGKLPEDIGQLECLEKLYLVATMIKHLPDSVCMLKHLNDLNLSRCGLLEKLPEDLGRLGCLKYLDILHTGISHLPQSIFGLKGLEIAASEEVLDLYDFPSERNHNGIPLVQSPSSSGGFSDSD